MTTRLAGRISTVSLLSVGANLAAVAKNAAFAARLGITGRADAAAYAESLLLFLPTLLLMRECFALFVSAYGHRLEHEGPSDAAAFSSSCLRLVALLGLALTVAVGLVPGQWVSVIAPGLSPELHARTAGLLRWVCPALMLQELAVFARTLHSAHHRYAVPGIVLIVGNLIQAVLLLAFSGDQALTAWAIGINGAALLQAVLLVALAPGLSFGGVARAPWLHPGLRRLGLLVAPVALGVVFVQAAGYLERMSLSFLPSGSLASLAYSRKLIAPFQTILAASIALPIYVTISRAKPGDEQGRTSVFLRGVDADVLLFVPIVVVMLLAAPEIVSVIYARGLFGTAEVAATVPLLRAGILVILPAALLFLVRDLLYARGNTRPLALGGVVQLGITAFANLIVAPRYGLVWIPIGVVAATWITCVVLLAVAGRFLPGEPLRATLRGALVAGGAGLAGGIVAWWVTRAAVPALPETFGLRCLKIGITGALAGGVYGVVLLLLRHPLAWRIARRIRARGPGHP